MFKTKAGSTISWSAEKLNLTNLTVSDIVKKANNHAYRQHCIADYVEENAT